MADNIKKLSKDDISEKKHEAELPLPPPPDTAQPSVTVTGVQEQCFMPPPPPKESFSKFYEQRQVNELKRLYRHMHPELRKNLEHAVSRDISELLSTDNPNQQASVSLDAVLPGEVQSMRWIFENWTLDTIGEHQGNRKLTEEEAVLGGNVKNTSLIFQGQKSNGGERASSDLHKEDQTKGDVKTALWLFETQPIDSLNKIYPEDADVQQAVLKEPVEKGDVKGTKILFETQSLDEVGRCNSVEEHSILQLKSEIQELKGEVNKTIKYFQTEPLCAIRDKTGSIHEIKSICREETQSNNVKTARWLFETQPLDTIQKDTSKVQIIRGISLEEIGKGGVNATKWIFETQPLDTIKENIDDGEFQPSVDTVEGIDVSKQCSIFEKQTHDSINKNTDSKLAATEEILPGDVKSTLWLFETQPMETLKGSLEVGQLKKVELLNEERGDVQQRKHVFETCSLDKITDKEDESTEQNATGAEEIIKGAVKSFKNLFETLPHESTKNRKGVQVSSQDEIKLGNVKANQALFESTPLYAIEDSLGNYHEVTAVSREQVISGDVKNYKWMFETKPLDQFNESIQKVDIIKGITKQEIISGDVGTARWLFETQPVDVIHPDKKVSDEKGTAQKEDLQKGDVNKCRWLFETQPIDQLYDKLENKHEKDPPIQGDVKSYTWMFETQPLDSIRDSQEHYIKVSIASPDKLDSVNVKTTKHLFETEPLDSLSSTREQRKMMRYSSRVEIQSGEVSRVKEIFESKPNVCVPLQKIDIPVEGHIPVGSVNKFTWLFENCPMDSIKIHEDGIQELPPEKDIESGDVGGKKFIFETYSLDQIHQDSDEKEINKVQEAVTKGDVKSCTMLFETKPLYAIQDKGGKYHEVTSVKKEEIQKGNVKGAKWLFETKPLDMINKDEEVFVIRAVTQEDIEKGCVKAARWRFETEPLDSITDTEKHTGRTVDDVQKGDVQLNRQLFESQEVNRKKYVRLVSVSDVQKGNVRTSTWLFENQPIDCLKGEDQEHCGIIKVQREDNQKGDVKRCTWLFESQPLDSLKDTESPSAPQATEGVPKANVKSTTWLFERTPLDKFDIEHSTNIEQKEISVKDTLDAFLSHNIIQHKGIVIENNNGGNVKMIKYQLSTQTATDIQKEEIVGGNLQRILLQLLHRTDIEPHGLLVEENSSGQIIATKLNLLNPFQSTEQEEENVRDDVSKALKILLNEDASTKTGIIMEESESGSVKIIIYALSLHCKFNMAQGDILKGNVKSTIGNLLACGQEHKSRNSVTREQNEKGNVQLFTSCIEKGDLGYLKSLQAESELNALAYPQSQSMQQEVDTKQCKQSTDKRKEGSECVFVTSTPVFHPVQLHKSVKECPVDGAMKAPDAQEASSGCKIEKRNICLSNTAESNTTVQKNTDCKQTSGEQNTSTLDKKFCVVGSSANTLQNNSTTSPDLQAALLDLRQATAEAKTIQKQVQCKIQNNAQEIQVTNQGAEISITQPVQATLHQENATAKQTASVTTTVKDTRTSYASLQTSTSSTKKVSVSEEEKASSENKEITRAETSNIKDEAEPPKQANNYLNPFNDFDYKEQIEQEERDQEIVRGDVKAAIRALQNASKEQKEIEKEEVVKGNLSSTLESLQKSNVNVSKGDFKAAMIYRNAGQSYAACKRNSDVQHITGQAMAKSMQPSDNNYPPPPAPVNEQEKCQAHNPSNVEATKDDSEKVNNHVLNTQFNAKSCGNTVHENANASQTCSVVQRKKPALPPKPKHLLPGVRPPPRHKNKASLPTPSSPTSKPSTPLDECSFKGITEPVNMHVQSPSNVPNACMYPSTNINPESGKEMLLHKEDKVCVQNHVLTNKNQTYQEESLAKGYQKSKDDTIIECSASSDFNISTHTMPEYHLKPISEHDINKQSLPENLEGIEGSPKSAVDVTQSRTSVSNADNKNVVMRIKRKKESEDARRQRLSIHMDEIMKGNVKAATDIFENLKKQDELEKILKKVTELEEKTSTVDVKSMRSLFETVPDWVVSLEEKASPLQEESQKNEISELQKEDSESVSSVELAFEDLERASAEIKHLKEQTLAKILDIEEKVKKALYAVSTLKSDSDIVSLSSLFRESLGTSSTTSNNIRKISIVSSKAKPEKPTQLFEQKCTEAINNQEKIDNKKNELEVTTSVSSRLSPTSPSYITIESAARKTSQQNNSSLPSAVISNQNGGRSQDFHKQNVSAKDQNGINSLQCLDPFHQWSVCDNGQSLSSGSLSIPATYDQNPSSPSSSNCPRQKSVLELKTGPEGPKVIGTTIVTEKYEESDQYGNKIVRSKTSTTVTKQSDTHSSSSFEFVSAPPRYEVTASPLLRRHMISSVENSTNKGSENGVVFVTFGNSKPTQK